ncbi:MAG: glycosyltransferase [Deltaproteobacteria bacterium]|nr:glycosyltransferase [Deltaproteobacteria bacterium]
MLTVVEIFFVISLLLIIYTYAGYYVVLNLVGRISQKNKFSKTGLEKYPHVSFLIAAYNEEKNILAKLHNIFESEYPAEKIAVYIVSDASTDRTHEIITSFENKAVHLIISQDRRGKTYCENLGLKKIKSDFIIFTDASTVLDKNCIHNMVKHFEFKEIGCVSTRDKSIKSDTNKGENLYVRYEMATRTLESRVDSLIGLSGSCYAARKKLCTDLPNYVTRDFALPLIAREKGYISVDEPDAICSVKPTENQKTEFARKTRTFTNGISTLFYKKSLLNIFRYGKFSFILWSHKVFRWLLPFFFIALFITNVMLFKLNIFYKFCLFLQIIYYILAFLGSQSISDNFFMKISRIFYFICMTNMASMGAWYNFFIGNKMAKWEPTER